MLQQAQTPGFSKQDKLFCMMAVFVYVAQLFYLPLHLAHADHFGGSHHSATVAIHQEHHAAENAAHESSEPGAHEPSESGAHEAIALENDHHDHLPHSVLDHSCDHYFQSNRSSLDSSQDVAALVGAGNSLALPLRASLDGASIRLRPPQSRPPGTAWSRGPPAIA